MMLRAKAARAETDRVKANKDTSEVHAVELYIAAAMTLGVDYVEIPYKVSFETQTMLRDSGYTTIESFDGKRYKFTIKW